MSSTPKKGSSHTVRVVCLCLCGRRWGGGVLGSDVRGICLIAVRNPRQ